MAPGDEVAGGLTGVDGAAPPPAEVAGGDVEPEPDEEPEPPPELGEEVPDGWLLRERP